MCRNNHTGTSTLTQHKNAIKSGIIQFNATEIDEMLDRWKISTTTMLKIRSMFGEKKSEIGINKRCTPHQQEMWGAQNFMRATVCWYFGDPLSSCTVVVLVQFFESPKC